MKPVKLTRSEKAVLRRLWKNGGDLMISDAWKVRNLRALKKLKKLGLIKLWTTTTYSLDFTIRGTAYANAESLGF